MADLGPMDRAPEPQGLPDLRGTYMVGDYINLELTVEHVMHLTDVAVVFVLEDDDSVELSVEGRPEPEDRNSRRMQSTVRVSRRVGVEDVPGTYVLSRLEAVTASTRTLTKEWGVRAVAFDIVPEPDEWNIALKLDQYTRGPVHPTDDEADY